MITWKSSIKRNIEHYSKTIWQHIPQICVKCRRFCNRRKLIIHYHKMTTTWHCFKVNKNKFQKLEKILYPKHENYTNKFLFPKLSLHCFSVPLFISVVYFCTNILKFQTEQDKTSTQTKETTLLLINLIIPKNFRIKSVKLYYQKSMDQICSPTYNINNFFGEEISFFHVYDPHEWKIHQSGNSRMTISLK